MHICTFTERADNISDWFILDDALWTLLLAERIEELEEEVDELKKELFELKELVAKISKNKTFHFLQQCNFAQNQTESCP